MGLFDFFRRKRRPARAPAPAPAAADAELDELLASTGEQEPRTQHYVFAHVALRQIAFANPIGCVGTLHSDKGREFLRSLWDDIGEQCRQSGKEATIDGSALAVRPVRVGDFPCAMVTMPPPVGTTEAHLVALVLHVKLGSTEPPPEKPELSYFTLEKGYNFETASERTVLCAWNAEGAHVNYGDGPPPDPRAFAYAVGQVIAGRREWVAGFNPGTNPGAGGDESPN